MLAAAPLLGAAQEVGRCQRAVEVSELLRSLPAGAQPCLMFSEAEPEETGQDAVPRRTWISRKNRLLMVGSCHELKDLALSLALQDAERRRGGSDEPIVSNEPTTG